MWQFKVCDGEQLVLADHWLRQTTGVGMAGYYTLDLKHLTISAEVSILYSKGLYLGVGHVHIHGIFCFL